MNGAIAGSKEAVFRKRKAVSVTEIAVLKAVKAPFCLTLGVFDVPFAAAVMAPARSLEATVGQCGWPPAP
jgi:hypothetical protein